MPANRRPSGIHREETARLRLKAGRLLDRNEFVVVVSPIFGMRAGSAACCPDHFFALRAAQCSQFEGGSLGIRLLHEKSQL